MIRSTSSISKASFVNAWLDELLLLSPQQSTRLPAASLESSKIPGDVRVLAEMLPLPDGCRDAGARQLVGEPMRGACPLRRQPTGTHQSQAWGHQDKEGLIGHPKQPPTILFNVRRAFLIPAVLIQSCSVPNTTP